MTTEPTSETRPHSSIHLLPEHLIDQIKAGEVIERPASLIKEILENSLDAEATKIDIHIVANGMDLISLTDNGKGMTFEDLPYAFCRHATSKITRFEDLYKLHSYGFRGEALASIGAVARVTLTSAPQENSPYGGKILFHGGECLAHDKQDNLPRGTSLYIKDLFYNTPARLKFVKSTQSEKNAIKRIIEAYLLAHPKVSFTVKWDDLDKDFYPQTDSIEERVQQVLCHKVKNKELFEIDATYEGHRVWGYFTHTSSRGHAHKRQYLFANKRIFTDRQIHQTVIRNLERLYPMGESGHYCLFLEVPENLIDVNVHPSKTQIKFFKLPVLTALISSELKKLSSQTNQIDAFHNTSGQLESSTRDPLPTEETRTSDVWERLTHQQSPYSGTRSQADSGVDFRTLKTTKDYYDDNGLDLITIHREGTPYLLSRSRFIGELFQAISNESQENQFIPLLISEPINYGTHELAGRSEKDLLEELEARGFICERLDEKTLALRALHRHLEVLKEPARSVEGLLRGENFEGKSFALKGNFVLKVLDSQFLEEHKFLTKIDSAFYRRNFHE